MIDISVYMQRMIINHAIEFFLLNLCHYYLGITSWDALSKDNDLWIVELESSVLKSLRRLLFYLPFLHILMIFFTSGYPRK